MNPNFVVKTTLDKNAQFEASRGAGSKFARILTYVLLGIAVVLIGVMIYIFLKNGTTKNLFIVIILLAGLAYLVYNQFFAPKRALQRWEDGMVKNYGVKEIHLTTEFYDRIFVQTNDITQEPIEEGFSSINDFRETEHLFLLQCRHQKWFFVDKAGFTVGTPEQFRLFFSERLKK